MTNLNREHVLAESAVQVMQVVWGWDGAGTCRASGSGGTSSLVSVIVSYFCVGEVYNL